MHRCSRCRQLKGPTAFYRDQRRRNGLTSECRACRAAYKKGLREQGNPATREPTLCDRCHDRQHGVGCLGIYADCECRCRAMLGLDLFEFGDPTAPTVEDRVVA